MEISYSRVALVIPSNRPDHLEHFFKKWEPHPWGFSVVVFDGPRSSLPKDHPADIILSWDSLDSMGDRSRIFSRRDSGIRIFGFLEAVRGGADYIVTLDDDCSPADGSNLIDAHVANLKGQIPRWVSSCDGVRVRGIPYGMQENIRERIAISHGLWENVADVDAVSTLSCRQPFALSGFKPPLGTRVVSNAQLIPTCGMNLAFAADFVYAMYWPIQGGRYRRFDDIWGGLIAQKVAHAHGMSVTTGEPHVIHERASDPFVNLEKEAPGIVAHERYWKIIDSCDFSGHSFRASILKFGVSLKELSGDDKYISELSDSIPIWVDLCDEAFRERQ